jgi:predicted alpha/beta-fold hydrolase
MPLIKSNYTAPWWMRHGDVATIIPNIFYAQVNPGYVRERITTPDKDFIDLDWLRAEGNKKLLIISHGLEGNSTRPYVVRMANYFYERGWDILAWNCRSCSGELNLQPRFYHHGATDDVEAVVDKALERSRYSAIVMTGFSMGGNLTLKYLGEQNTSLPPVIKGAVVYSTPVDLPSSVAEMGRRRNHYYKMRFLKKLEVKVKAKALVLKDRFPSVDFKRIREFPDFDNLITAPIHGFKDADDFYKKVSSKPFIKHITVPTLIVNALNDPFLGKDCFPYEEVQDMPHVYLETPPNGGHVGFTLSGKDYSYMELRTEEFLKAIL